MNTFLLLKPLLLIIPVIVLSQNYCDYNSTIKFARYLEEKGDYFYAILELERILFFNPGDTSVLFMLAKDINRMSDCDFKIMKLKNLNKLYPRNHTIYSMLLETALKCDISLTSVSEELNIENIPASSRNCYLIKLNLKNGNIKECKRLLSEDTTLIKYGFSKCVDEIYNARWKSPLLAGVLSAIIPGSGKMYAGYPKDGLVSLMTVLLTGGLALYGYQKYGLNSTLFWISGGFCASFYLADIYGSVKAALLYNKHKYLEKVSPCLDIDCY